MLKGQRGEGKFGCLVVLLLLAIFVFICLKTVPVYLDKLDFEDGLSRIASRAGAEAAKPKLVVERVLALAAGKEFEVTEDDVTVQQIAKFGPAPEIKISVTFRRTVKFPGFDYTFHFESTVSSFVGRL